MLEDAGPAGDWTRHVQTVGDEWRDQKSKASVQIQPGLPREGLVAYFKSRKDREGPSGMTRRGSTVSVTRLREEDFQVLWHASAVRQGRRRRVGSDQDVSSLLPFKTLSQAFGYGVQESPQKQHEKNSHHPCLVFHFSVDQ